MIITHAQFISKTSLVLLCQRNLEKENKRVQSEKLTLDQKLNNLRNRIAEEFSCQHESMESKLIEIVQNVQQLTQSRNDLFEENTELLVERSALLKEIEEIHAQQSNCQELNLLSHSSTKVDEWINMLASNQEQLLQIQHETFCSLADNNQTSDDLDILTAHAFKLLDDITRQKCDLQQVQSERDFYKVQTLELKNAVEKSMLQAEHSRRCIVVDYITLMPS